MSSHPACIKAKKVDDACAYDAPDDTFLGLLRSVSVRGCVMDIYDASPPSEKCREMSLRSDMGAQPIGSSAVFHSL